MYDISVISVFQDNKDLVDTFLASLRSVVETSLQLKIEVVLVDNCSHDGTFERLYFYQNEINQNKSNIHIKLIKTVTKRSLPENRNAGAYYTDSKILMFVDSDVLFSQEKFFEKIINIWNQERPDILCPSILNVNNNRIQTVGVKCGTGILKYKAYMFMNGRDFDSLDKDLMFNVEMVHGAAFLISTDLFLTLKGFDEEMKPYNFDEMDLIFRSHKYKPRILSTTKIMIRHFGSGTTSKIRKTLRGYYFTSHLFRSMILNEGQLGGALFSLIYLIPLSYVFWSEGYGNPLYILKALFWAMKRSAKPLNINFSTKAQDIIYG
ncbi:MAG: glycosyltransferase [Nitrososphaerota archaeon]|jgi:glycosyltransferase involved in cell wall biosynthesis|nr:glycosyltransferase [Nitrososphaerota archaeon]MDG7038098.1 glycosyltransferase [Nitrososphaerota archaeon]